MAGNPMALLTKPRATPASADFAGRRMERVFDRESREVSIRFSVWTGARSPSPLGCLRRASGPLGDLVAANLFSAAFLGGTWARFSARMYKFDGQSLRRLGSYMLGAK